MATKQIQANAVIQQHNQTVLDELEAGDLIEFKRGLYSHWAVYAGDQQVVHLAGVGGGDGLNNNVAPSSAFTICGKIFDKACVKLDDYWDVCLDCKAYKNNSKDNKLKPDERNNIVERALSKLGNIGYNVLWSNCEHFAAWCRYGVEWSEQSSSFLKWTAVAVGTAFAAIGAMMYGRSKPKTNKQ